MSNIFKVYKYLTEENIKTNDVLSLSGIKTATFYKYLNLFKKAGFDVTRVQEIHKIILYTGTIKLSDAEIGMIAYMLLLSNMLFSKYKNRVFSKIIDKMLKYTNKQTEAEVYNKFELMKKASEMNLYKEKIELFEKFKNENLEIFLTLKNGEKLICKPKDISYKNKKIYFNFINKKNREINQIDIEKIVKLTPDIKETVLNAEVHDVIFELYGRLAKIYLLKEGERIIDSSPDKITVANSASDKEELFKRLLRYDTLCKVKFPKKDADSFKKIIEKSLENIDSIKDNIYEEIN